MKKLITLIAFVTLGAAGAFAQSSHWESVVVTRDREEVKDLVKVEELSVTSSIPYAGQKKLRKKATEKLKKEAAEKGIEVVLIEVDNFSVAPINNVNLVGTGYRKKRNGE